MEHEKASEKYNKGIVVIRHYGTPDKAQLPDGTWVERQDKLWIPEWGRFITCAPYDDHFLFQVPVKYKGSSIQCSCGSISVISGLSGYVLDASAQGLLALCWHHATYGYHATGGSRWI